MSIFHSDNEFIFKSSFDLLNDLNKLKEQANEYLQSMKDPSDFWNESDKESQRNRIKQVLKYIDLLNDIEKTGIAK